MDYKKLNSITKVAVVLSIALSSSVFASQQPTALPDDSALHLVHAIGTGKGSWATVAVPLTAVPSGSDGNIDQFYTPESFAPLAQSAADFRLLTQTLRETRSYAIDLERQLQDALRRIEALERKQ